MTDPYAPCPCGSGKKFKWCCQPVYADIQKAEQQYANNQHEAALKTMEQVCAAHPQNPEAWGRRAELLYASQQVEQAEQAIDQSLKANPNYAYGYYLRGMFRFNEGEHNGALLLYRKAAELCPAEARERRADIHLGLGQVEALQLRPLAAHAAWEIARTCVPNDPNIENLYQQYFGPEGPLPPLARKAYPYLKPQGEGKERQAAWARGLAGFRTGTLKDAAAAFTELTQADAGDAAAWYNLALTQAWRGDNRAALEALGRYLDLEADEDRAADAAALGEVLRFAADLTDVSDWEEQQAVYPIRDMQGLSQALQKQARLIDLQRAPNGMGIGATLIDRDPPKVHEHLALFELPRVVAYVVLVPGQLILAHNDPLALAKARSTLEPLLAATVGTPQVHRRTTPFNQVMHYILGVRLPEGVENEQARRLLDACVQQYFEEDWIKRPLKSLGGVPPVDAVGHARLRKQVLGLVRFWEDLAPAFYPFPYNFDRLRHKLGLPATKPAEAAAAPGRDFGAMNAADLAALVAKDLNAAELLQAFQAAQRLDARELAGRFAADLVERPVEAGQASDRFPLYQHLYQLALEQEDFAAAHARLDSAQMFDAQHNEGRRHGDYELRRAQAHLKAKAPEQARDVFRRLIERSPTNLDVLGKATEAMLSARQKADAAAFAEQGLTQARKAGDRDRIGYFEELLAAAKK